jgi:hypothetical protein
MLSTLPALLLLAATGWALRPRVAPPPPASRVVPIEASLFELPPAAAPPAPATAEPPRPPRRPGPRRAVPRETDDPRPPAAVPREAPEPTPPPPPSEAAQAAETLSVPEGLEAPFDIVHGEADTFPGGMTSSGGTSTTPVEGGELAAGGGDGFGKPTGLARSAYPLSSAWACPWPTDSKVLNAWVTLVVRVGVDGRPLAVKVVRADAPSFAFEATRCAMRERFRPARADDGTPIEAETAPFRVRFTR